MSDKVTVAKAHSKTPDPSGRRLECAMVYISQSSKAGLLNITKEVYRCQSNSCQSTFKDARPFGSAFRMCNGVDKRYLGKPLKNRPILHLCALKMRMEPLLFADENAPEWAFSKRKGVILPPLHIYNADFHKL